MLLELVTDLTPVTMVTMDVVKTVDIGITLTVVFPPRLMEIDGLRVADENEDLDFVLSTPPVGVWTFEVDDLTLGGETVVLEVKGLDQEWDAEELVVKK